MRKRGIVLTGLAVLGAGLGLSRIADATTVCSLEPSGTNAGSFTSGSSPNITYCWFPGYTGTTAITTGPGVDLLAQDQSGTTVAGTYAIEADTTSNTAIHAYANTGNAIYAQVATGTTVAVIGQSGTGVSIPSDGYGIWGTSESYDGVHADVNNTANAVGGTNQGNGNGAVFTAEGLGYGVYGKNTATSGCSGTGCIGALGSSVDGYGVYGTSTSNYGVYGTSTTNDGVHGQISGANNAAVGGVNTGNGQGVSGGAQGTGWGVSGQNFYSGSCTLSSQQCTGVFAQSTGGYGVYATSTNADGVNVSISNGNSGVNVTNSDTTGGYAIYATNSSTSTATARFISSGNYNAIYATNTRTDQNAAVISAAAGSSAGLAYYGGGAVNITGKYYQNGTCVAGCSSDERLKKDIRPLSGADAIESLLRLRGVTFEWKEPAKQGTKQEGKQTGLIAQDVEKVFPQWVGESDDGFKTLNIRQTHIAALEVESIRTLKTENDLLKERVAALESGRQPRISGFNLNGVGFGVGGLAIGLGLVVSKRKRQAEKQS